MSIGNLCRKESKMKNRIAMMIVSVLILITIIGFAGYTTMKSSQIGGEVVETRIGNLSFTHDFANGYPTHETVEKLFDEIDFQRATQAYIWVISIVSFAQCQYAHEETFGAKSGDIVYYPNYVSKLGILTANPTTPYAASYMNLAETGPIVIEMPKAEVRGANALFVDTIGRPLTPLSYAGTARRVARRTARHHDHSRRRYYVLCRRRYSLHQNDRGWSGSVCRGGLIIFCRT